jgi:hypothetical protein
VVQPIFRNGVGDTEQMEAEFNDSNVSHVVTDGKPKPKASRE